MSQFWRSGLNVVSLIPYNYLDKKVVNLRWILRFWRHCKVDTEGSTQVSFCYVYYGIGHSPEQEIAFLPHWYFFDEFLKDPEGAKNMELFFWKQAGSHREATYFSVYKNVTGGWKEPKFSSWPCDEVIFARARLSWEKWGTARSLAQAHSRITTQAHSTRTSTSTQQNHSTMIKIFWSLCFRLCLRQTWKQNI